MGSPRRPGPATTWRRPGGVLVDVVTGRARTVYRITDDGRALPRAVDLIEAGRRRGARGGRRAGEAGVRARSGGLSAGARTAIDAVAAFVVPLLTPCPGPTRPSNTDWRTLVNTVQLYTYAAPAHDHALFIASRPLPGRHLGNAAGMVHDVAPEFQDGARLLDAQPITLITPAAFERLAEGLVQENGYTRAQYEDADCWDPEDIARQRGHAVITIVPTVDAGPLIPVEEQPDAPEFPGEYASVGADEFHLGSMQIVPPGAYIGEDPEPSEDYSLIFGDPYDKAVCVHGTPEQLRWFAARVNDLVATLPGGDTAGADDTGSTARLPEPSTGPVWTRDRHGSVDSWRRLPDAEVDPTRPDERWEQDGGCDVRSDWPGLLHTGVITSGQAAARAA
jgi:hypothetical protein